MKEVFYILFTLVVSQFYISQSYSQAIWAAGYTEQLDTIHNGQVLIIPGNDTTFIQPFDSPVQFESTMAGMYSEEGDILFYTNGCHLYDQNHQIIEGGDQLNPGEIHDLVCPDYGYIAPKGISVVTFNSHPNRYFLIHTGLLNTISHSLSYRPLYITKLRYVPDEERIEVISKNEILIAGEVDPFTLIRHGNGNDWWLITNNFGTATYHTMLISPMGVEKQDTQNIGFDFPFPPCRWQRSLSASPSGDRLVRFSSKCGAQYLTFDRCSGELQDAGFSTLANGIFGGGGSAFSEDSEFVYFSRWYRIIKVPFTNPPDTLKASFTPPFGFGGSFVHMFRAPTGHIYIAPQASEPYLHVIEPGDTNPDTADVQFEGLRLPVRVQRTIPNYPDYTLGPLSDSDCDTIVSSSNRIKPILPLLTVSPNPSTGQITISTSSIGVIKISNVYGQIIQSHNMEKDDLKSWHTSISLPGIYLVTFRDKISGLSVARKVYIAY